MAMEIAEVLNYGSLQSELEQAKNSLKGFDESIKRLIGRDPSELIPRQAHKRNVQNDESRNKQRTSSNNKKRSLVHDSDEPAAKRRSSSSVFNRLSERSNQYEEETEHPQKQLISKVIVTPKEVPSRQEALAAQNSDLKFKERNRRMFGALLGTLQKFQQEETKLKSREEKRAQLEKKIEEHELQEKAEIKKERQELFLNRKKEQAKIKMIELKMLRMKEYGVWEERQRPRMNFITTKAKPAIQYLPKRLNDTTKQLLESCKNDIENSIENRRQAVLAELKTIEDRMKRNFDGKKSKEEKQNEDRHEDSPDEQHMDFEHNDSVFNHISTVDEHSFTQSNGDFTNTNKEHTIENNETTETHLKDDNETKQENEYPNTILEISHENSSEISVQKQIDSSNVQSTNGNDVE